MAVKRNQDYIPLAAHMVAADDSHSDSMCPLHPTTAHRGGCPEKPSFVECQEVLVCGFERMREWVEGILMASCSDLPCPMDLDRARALMPWVERKERTLTAVCHRRLGHVGGGCDTSGDQKGYGEGIWRG